MTSLWDFDELKDLFPSIGEQNISVSGISIDTRTLEQGDLFFAIKGDVFDGHLFVSSALEKGASAVVVEEGRQKEFSSLGGAIIAVPSVLEALILLGKAARNRSHAQIIAVTGSVGKTSTKEMLRFALQKQGKTHASIASYNNHWGVPLTLARMPRDTEYGIFEIGMNHADEIRPLVSMVCPHCAIITTVGPVHLEYFSSIEAISDAKCEIFSALEAGGTAILNRDSDYFERMKSSAFAQKTDRVVSFGENQLSDIQVMNIREDAQGNHIDVQVFGVPFYYHIGLYGHHMVLNSLAVLAAVHSVGADWKKAMQDLHYMKVPKGRGERTELKLGDGAFILIDESYNANPTSMKAALKALGNVKPEGEGRRIAILGPMRELGGDEIDLHRSLVDVIQKAKIEYVFLSGDLMKYLYDALPDDNHKEWKSHVKEFITPVCNFLKSGDVVMIKGSLSTQMGIMVDALKECFHKSA